MRAGSDILCSHAVSQGSVNKEWTTHLTYVYGKSHAGSKKQKKQQPGQKKLINFLFMSIFSGFNRQKRSCYMAGTFEEWKRLQDATLELRFSNAPKHW